jgi:hypothetical protein
MQDTDEKEIIMSNPKKIITKLIGDKNSHDFRSLGDTFFNPNTGQYESLKSHREAWKTKTPGKKGPMQYTLDKRKNKVR